MSEKQKTYSEMIKNTIIAFGSNLLSQLGIGDSIGSTRKPCVVKLRYEEVNDDEEVEYLNDSEVKYTEEKCEMKTEELKGDDSEPCDVKYREEPCLGNDVEIMKRYREENGTGGSNERKERVCLDKLKKEEESNEMDRGVIDKGNVQTGDLEGAVCNKEKERMGEGKMVGSLEDPLDSFDPSRKRRRLTDEPDMVCEEGDRAGEERAVSRAVRVVSGSLHTLVLTDRNELFSFGCDDEKALGRGGREDYPFRVVLPSRKDVGHRKKVGKEGSEELVITDMGCGQSSSFVLTEEGYLFGWGLFRDKSGPIGFLKRDPEDSKGWGGKKVVGVRATMKAPLKPSKEPAREPVLISKKVQWMSVGANHVVYKTHDGVYSIGGNSYGERGSPFNRRRSKVDQLSPSIFANRRSRTFKEGKVFCGSGNTVIALPDECLALGDNLSGQFGSEPNSGAFRRKVSPIGKEISGSPSPKRIKRDKIISSSALEETIVKVVSGENHLLFLTTQGNVYGAGNNELFQLGYSSDKPQGAQPSGLKFIMGGCDDIRSGGFFSAARKKNGVWYTWGFNSSGECGHEGEHIALMEVPTLLDLALGHDFCIGIIDKKEL